MKKRSLLPLMAFLLLSISVVFNSCSDDDGGGYQSDILGEWKVTDVSGTSTAVSHDGTTDVYEHSLSQREVEYLTMHKDGTWTAYSYYIDEPEESWDEADGTWTISGDQLIIDGEASFTIVKLTSSTLILNEYREEGESEYYSSYTVDVTTTYTKVNE